MDIRESYDDPNITILADLSLSYFFFNVYQ